MNEISEMISNIKSQANITTSSNNNYLEAMMFVAVGLFVLIAMNMMLNMGKSHITYKFSIE